MFDFVKAVDGDLLLNNGIDLFELKDAELRNSCQPSQLCLLTSNGHKYGPYGTDSHERKQVTKIDHGDIFTHAFKNSIQWSIQLSNDNFFYFHVSFFI